MADRGFTIKDILNDIGVELNIPPFMDGRKQLPAEEISKGRKICSISSYSCGEGNWKNEVFQYSKAHHTNYARWSLKSDSLCMCLFVKF